MAAAKISGRQGWSPNGAGKRNFRWQWAWSDHRQCSNGGGAVWNYWATIGAMQPGHIAIQAKIIVSTGWIAARGRAVDLERVDLADVGVGVVNAL